MMTTKMITITAWTPRTAGLRLGGAAVLLAAIGVLSLPGCSGVEKAPPRPRAANAGATMTKDVEPIMRGTVGAACWMDGYRDTVVRDYGFVVGLKGTGHRTLDAPIRAYMLDQMARMGVGSEQSGFNIPPEDLIDSMDTAVVLVEAIIPAGAPEGSRFDVRVSALRNTETTSLEGGTLWTTEMRPAISATPSVGPRRASPIAMAYGHVFTNPFVDPDSGEAALVQAGTNVNLLSGRVLGGGMATRDMPLKLRLVTPSHNIASILQQVINSQFPQEPGQSKPTAWGESDSSLSITVPPSFHADSREFVRLLEHTTLDRANQHIVVQFISRTLKEQPGAADHASWRWQALGRQVIPSVKEFYDYPEEGPRYAALRAGARLDDPAVIRPLMALAKNASPGIRKEAIRLLGEMRTDAEIVVGLRELLNDDNVDVRVAAYEALEKSRTTLVRTAIVDNKYRVDYVESERPLVYVALMKEPRIVVFDRDLEVDRPMTMSAWASRLMLKGDYGGRGLDVAFRSDDGTQAIYREVEPNLTEFIPFLGHTTSIEEPRPGLGLSYSETISVLYALHLNQHLMGAEFLTEADRLRIAILEREAEPGAYEDRPLFDEEESSADSTDTALNLPEDMERLPESGGVGSPADTRRERPTYVPN